MSNNLTIKMDAPAESAAPAAMTRHDDSPVAMLFQPTSKAEAMHMLQCLASSNMVPKAFKGDPWGIAIAIDTGHRLGYGILQSLQNIAVINGKPTVYGDELLARCKRDALYEYVKESLVGDWDKGDAVATCRAKRKGEDEVVRTFSKDDAKRARLVGKDGPWTQYPMRMLQMRARGFALRDCFTDALQGVISREEAEDYPIRDSRGQPAEYPTGPIVDDVLPTAEGAAAALDDAGQLSVVLTALAAARSPEALHKAGLMARKLPPELRQQAKDAYRAARAVADPEAHAKWSQVEQAKQDTPPPSDDDAPPADGAGEAAAEPEPIDTAELESLRRGLEVCESEGEWLKIKHALGKADPRIREALRAEYDAAGERVEQIQAAEDEKWANER